MTVNLSVTHIYGIKSLRALIINQLPSIIKGCSIIDTELPVPGEPILALSADNKPLLVCFDTESAQQALMSGLTAIKHVKQQHRLINQLYPQLDLGESSHSTILVLITPETIPGDDCCFRQDGSILFYTFRGINIDGETQLLLEPAPFNTYSNNNHVNKHSDNNSDEYHVIPNSYEPIDDSDDSILEDLESSLLSKKEEDFFKDV